MMEVRRTAGLGSWQLAATLDDRLPPELAAVNARRRRDPRATAPLAARAIWKRPGGSGQCPRVVVDAVAMSLSSFESKAPVSSVNSQSRLWPSAGSASISDASCADAASVVAENWPPPDRVRPNPSPIAVDPLTTWSEDRPRDAKKPWQILRSTRAFVGGGGRI